MFAIPQKPKKLSAERPSVTCPFGPISSHFSTEELNTGLLGNFSCKSSENFLILSLLAVFFPVKRNAWQRLSDEVGSLNGPPGKTRLFPASAVPSKSTISMSLATERC